MFKFPEDRTFIVAEIGINHNGSVEIAKKLIDVAVAAGCDAVKFQKRVPSMSLPLRLWDVERDTPWGERMTYLRYRERIELSYEEYWQIHRYCRCKGIVWFASPWDKPSVDFLYDFEVPLFKVASASVTDLDLLNYIAGYDLPVIMSTGMSSLEEIDSSVNILQGVPELALLVCTSTYPAKITDLNLDRIPRLQKSFPHQIIGYSGHESGLWTTLCAVAMGARIVERHITLDRAMPGTDQAASVEPQGLIKLVKEIRAFEQARGSAEIRVLDCEQASIKRLRG